MIVGKSILGAFSLFIKPRYTQFRQLSRKSYFMSLCKVHNYLKYNFSTVQNSYFIFSVDKQPQLLKLQLEYRSQQNVSIFQQQIKASTGILDQMNIFKIFKVMETSTYKHSSYQEFFDFVRDSIRRKSDNMLLLLATVKERMAKNYKSQKNIPQTIVSLEQSLEILEQCMVPPLLPYYSVYRQYGLLMHQLGNIDKARQILIESVEILDDFVSHSDDNVSTNSYCRKQASAYNVLAEIDGENGKKWIDKAQRIWEKFTQNRWCEVEYAKTVGNSLKWELKADKEKGQAFYNFNFYKFQTNEMKNILKKAKQQASF